MTDRAEDSAAPRIRPPGLASRYWPVLVAGLVASLFASHLLITSDPFIGSGTDIVAIEYPLRAFAHSRLADGDLPLWNPYHLGGVPFQTGVHGYLSPSFWTTAFLRPVLDMKVGIVLHLALASAGAAWLARRRTGSAAAAILAGITFGLSGFMMSHLFAGHPRLVFTAAYLPWVVGLVEKAVREFPRGVTGAAVVCALMLLCGHYHIVFIGLLGTGVFVVLDRTWVLKKGSGTSPETLLALAGDRAVGARPLFQQRASRGLAVMALVVVVAALLAAVQLVPTAEALRLSQRSGGDADFAARYASAPVNLLTLIWPNLFGNFVEAPFFGHWAYWESLAYIGLVPLVLLAAAPMVMPWRQWSPAAMVMLLGLVLSMGAATPVFEVFARLVPGAGLFRGAGRYVLLTTLFGSLLAAQVLGRWMDQAVGLSRRRLAVLWLLPVMAVLFGGWLATQSATEWQQRWAEMGRRAESPVAMSTADWGRALDLAKGDAAAAVAILTAAVGLLWGAGRFGFRRWAAALLVVLAVVDLYGFGHRFLSTGDRSRMEWPDELVAFLEENREPGLRIIDDPDLLCPARGAAIGVGHVGGHDTLVDESYVRYMNRANGKDPDQFVTYIRTLDNTPMHDRLGARYVLSATPLDQAEPGGLLGFDDWEFEGRFGDVWVYGNPNPQPRVFITHSAEALDEAAAFIRLADSSFDLRSALLVEEAVPAAFGFAEARLAEPMLNGDSARIVTYEPDRVEIEVEAASAGALVLSDNWNAGWRASVDGQPVPVFRANRVMRAVPVPSGRHRLVFEYRPREFTFGAGVSVLSLVGLVTWRFRHRRRDVHLARTSARSEDRGSGSQDTSSATANTGPASKNSNAQ